MNFSFLNWLIFISSLLHLAAPQPGLFGLQSSGKERIVNPLVQECLDAVTEHQRLRLLMKGEWFKGLLPLSNVSPNAIVQRIRGKSILGYRFLRFSRAVNHGTVLCYEQILIVLQNHVIHLLSSKQM